MKWKLAPYRQQGDVSELEHEEMRSQSFLPSPSGPTRGLIP